MGIQDYPIGKLGIRVNIRQLLDGYEPLIERQQRRHQELGKEGRLEEELFMKERFGRGYPDINISINNDNKQSQGDNRPVNTTINQHGQGDNFGGDKVLGDKINTQINNSADLAAAVRDIKALFAELDQSYDKTTPLGQMQIATKTIEAIENKPTVKKRLLNAVKEGGTTALEEMIEHPAIKPVVAAIKGYIDT